MSRSRIDGALFACAAGATTFVMTFSTSSLAHRPSDAFLTLSETSSSLVLRVDVPVRDLDFVLGFDENADGAVTWGELRGSAPRLGQYVLQRLNVASDGRPCALAQSDELRVAQHSSGTYAVLTLDVRCDARPRLVALDYRLFFDVDTGHRALLAVAGGDARSVLSPANRAVHVPLAENAASSDRSDHAASFASFFVEGVWHILIGFDHILFLLALLLPAVLRREDRRWRAHDDVKDVAREVVSIVTAFTVAHTITLCLAATGTVQMPSMVVETAIAVSVVLVALNNVVPVYRDGRWTLTFALGLLHGFGFSSVLADLGLPVENRAVPLLAFNVGVEAGQLAIVAVLLPIAFLLRRTWFWQRLVVGVGSLVIALLAAVWAVERAFALQILPT